MHRNGTMLYMFALTKWCRNYPGRCVGNFKEMSNSICRTVASALDVKLFPSEYHGPSLMRSEHWFKFWLGGVRQQANTWENTDLILCKHMVSLSHNVLNLRVMSTRSQLPSTKAAGWQWSRLCIWIFKWYALLYKYKFFWDSSIHTLLFLMSRVIKLLNFRCNIETTTVMCPWESHSQMKPYFETNTLNRFPHSLMHFN